MEVSNKGFSSKPKSSNSGENDENILPNIQQRGTKKPVKHFMSSTVSAASKAFVPRKKILGEKNQAFTNFSDTQLLKNSNIESKTLPLHPRNSQSGQTSHRVISDEYENNPFPIDTSMKPYDPLTNYLSPRPKFLRYNPNRRREIISHPENEEEEEEEEEKVLKIDAQVSSFPPMVKGDENDDELEEEYEEIKEGKSSLKGFIHFLLVIFVLFLSTSYILSMNLPNPSYTQQAISRIKHECIKVHQLFTVKKVHDQTILEENAKQGFVFYGEDEQIEDVLPHQADETDEILNDVNTPGHEVEAIEESFDQEFELEKEIFKEQIELEEFLENEAIKTEVLTSSGVKSLEISLVLVLLISLTLIGSLIYIFYSRKTRFVGENLQKPQINLTEKGIITETLKTVSFEKPSVTKESSHEYAPIVELLGELVINENSSRRRINKSMSDFALTTDSPLYGSFTSEKKILKKEGKDGEAKVAVISTPVRRSSRLLSRTTMSP